MKYSFLSSPPAWPPSALMMAVSASGASSEPLASWVRYVPGEGGDRAAGHGGLCRCPLPHKRGGWAAWRAPLGLAAMERSLGWDGGSLGVLQAFVAVSTCGVTTAKQVPVPPPTRPGKAGGPSCPQRRVGGSTHTSPQGVADGGVAPCPQGLGTNLLGMKRAGGGKGGGGRQREQQEEGGGDRDNPGTEGAEQRWRTGLGAASPWCHPRTLLTFPRWCCHRHDTPRPKGSSAGSSQEPGRAAGAGAASLHTAPRAPCSPPGRTFVPDQVMSQHDEEAEQQEDNDSHHPADHRVVGAGGRGHRAGVCPGRGREKREGAETLQEGKGCCCSPPGAPSCAGSSILLWILGARTGRQRGNAMLPSGVLAPKREDEQGGR